MMSAPVPDSQNILIINPNSSSVMTASLTQLISTLHLPATIQTTLWNPASGPPSINNDADAAMSCECVLQELPVAPGIDLQRFDAFLVACYSMHPLTKELPRILPPKKCAAYVLGIFEASIRAALALLEPLEVGDGNHAAGCRFGIVTTGMYWESALAVGVQALLSSSSGDLAQARGGFKDVASTGLSAGELHSTPPEEVRARIEEATRRLVRDGDVRAVCLGCAGMAGMDEIVRDACVKELGEEKGGMVWIVDGVIAGINLLLGLVTSSAVTI